MNKIPQNDRDIGSDICKRIMIERSLQLDASSGHLSGGGVGGRCATRPTDLPTENRQWIRNRKQLVNVF